MDNTEYMETLRENGNKPFRINEQGRIFIGDNEFPYPVSDGSVKVERMGRGRHHLVTMTILVGSVDMQQRPPRYTCPECGVRIFSSTTLNRCTTCDAELPNPSPEG